MLPACAAHLVVLTLVSCTAATTRPPFAPLPEAFADTVAADPEQVIREIQQRLTEEGLAISRISVIDGFLETDWYDIVMGEPARPDPAHPGRFVRLRFWADPVVNGRTALTGEAVHRRTSDPSVPTRLTEQMVPPEHPARRILRGIFDGVRERFGTGQRS
jgi:hypothetical protein